MRYLLCFLFTFSIFNARGAVDVAKSMVPRGKIIEELGRDFIVRTEGGTNVKIEFSLDGKFQEASGKNLNQGDELEPGDGLISLSTAAQALQKTGVKPQGYWLLEKDPKMGWIYEVRKNVVSAKSGEILLKSPEVSISENASEDTSQNYHQNPSEGKSPPYTE
ncbi:MAG: hypothetical protein ACLGHN_01250 [Bacteriovoracia bacterium]